jgi:hypothetical protein
VAEEYSVYPHVNRRMNQRVERRIKAILTRLAAIWITVAIIAVVYRMLS